MDVSKHKLKLNNDKTALLIIVLSQQTHKCNIASIKIDDCDVTKSDYVRNLGIKFDSTMQMKQQIAAVVKGCNIQIRAIGRIHKFLTTEATSNLIHAFINSRLDYGNSLLYELTDTDIQRLQKVQNTTARILTRTRNYDYISPILYNLHWLTLKYRTDFNILMA